MLSKDKLKAMEEDMDDLWGLISPEARHRLETEDRQKVIPTLSDRDSRRLTKWSILSMMVHDMKNNDDLFSRVTTEVLKKVAPNENN